MASTLSSETRLDFHDKVQLPRLYLVWPSTPAFDEDEAALDVLGTVLADGRSSQAVPDARVREADRPQR